MNRDARTRNTGDQLVGSQPRSAKMRHEASTVTRKRRSRGADTGEAVERLTTVRYVRRLVYAPDAGGPKAACELEFQTTRRGKHLVQVDPVDLKRPHIVIAKAINQTALYPMDEAVLTAQVEGCTQSNPPQVTLTTISGWRASEHGRAFVTPTRTFGPGRKAYRYAQTTAQQPAAGQLGAVRGTVKGWRRRVGRYLEMSTAGRVLLGAALAAPLLRDASFPESWIMLLCGRSTSGKSTLLTAVASFQGAEASINPSTSDRRFSEEAAKHNDLLLPVGDLSQLKREDRRRLLHWLTMDLTSGTGRQVSRAVGDALPDLAFTTVAVATAEQTSVEIAREAGVRRLPGEQVRCFDLPPGEDGYFDRRGSSGLTADVIAQRLGEGAVDHHGVGLKAWVLWLAGQDQARLLKRVSSRIAEFVQSVGTKSDLSPLEARMARKFGLIYAALVLGREAMLVGVPEQGALVACRKAFKGAVKAAAAADPNTAVMALKSALCSKGAVIKTFQGQKAVTRQMRQHPDWMAIETKRGGTSAIGLHPPSARKILGQCVADIAISQLQDDGLLSNERGVDRWQKKLPGMRTKVRLLQLNPTWLER